nr:ATP-dependent DNA helicase PIF1-like [Rhipicephalus microplus]
MREQVLLYVPFRNEAVDVLDHNKYLETFEANKDLIATKHRQYNIGNDDDIVAQLIEEHRIQQQREEDAAAVDAAVVAAVPADEDADLLPNEDLMRAVKDTSPCAAVRKRQDVMDREEYTRLMRMTNAEQYELLREIIHRQTTLGALPLRVFLTGPAGCGKTFVLKLVMDVYNRYNDNAGPYNAFVICASTGKAAVAVGGTTVHSAFKLTRNKKDLGLGDSELNTFRVAFRYVKCIIVDEVSMLSSDNLNTIDCRLKQITQKLDEPFGGLDVLMCGDLRQLPPVRANEVYKRCREAGGLFGATIKWHYLDYFPLVQVVRQSDASFSALLTKIGDGRALQDDEVRLLESCFVTTEEVLVRASSAIRLFYSNEEVNKFNTFIAQRGGGEVVSLQAEDTYLGCANQDALNKAIAKVEKMSHTKFANLPHEILIVLGKPYMITTNIDVIDGLVNGAVGILKVCERAVNDGDLPKRLWLHFDDATTTGKLTRLRSKRMVNEAKRSGHVIDAFWVPIEPRVTTLTLDRKTGVACKRRQLPLVQASAITVHKSQRGTYSSIVYEYNKTHPQKLVYVALSRCANVNNLYLTNAKGDQRFYHKDKNEDTAMLNEFQRLGRHRLPTVTQQYQRSLREDVDSSNEFTIALLNVRSLNAHALDIERDPILTAVDVLCFTETWNVTRLFIKGYVPVVCTLYRDVERDEIVHQRIRSRRVYR